VTLAQFGPGPVVINFWASWCPPCRKEMPALAAAARQFNGRVDFVGVDTSDDRNAAIAFAAHSRVGYPLGFDPQAVVAGNYGVFGLPTTYFVAGGKIVGRATGGMSQALLEQLLNNSFPELTAPVTP
jgi:cytochrome c biogenesis protein CcmG/thiol:disulfide interchange protein DsbE